MEGGIVKRKSGGEARGFPKGRAVDPQALAEVQALLGNEPRRRDLLVEHLHRIQDRYGHISAPHLAALAREMGLATTEVYEVATFYHHFDVIKENDAPPPALTVRVCDSLACELAGARGLMADLKLPTAADGLGNDKTEGALTFPIAYELGAGWSAAGMTSVEYVHNGSDRRAVWVNTITFAREIMPDLGGFLELTSAAGDGSHVATFNCGLTRALGPMLQLDCGVNVGISRTAPDLTVFAGLARKF